jgi:hypothetical protein
MDAGNESLAVCARRAYQAAAARRAAERHAHLEQQRRNAGPNALLAGDDERMAATLVDMAGWVLIQAHKGEDWIVMPYTQLPEVAARQQWLAEHGCSDIWDEELDAMVNVIEDAFRKRHPDMRVTQYMRNSFRFTF